MGISATFAFYLRLAYFFSFSALGLGLILSGSFVRESYSLASRY